MVVRLKIRETDIYEGWQVCFVNSVVTSELEPDLNKIPPATLLHQARYWLELLIVKFKTYAVIGKH